MQKIEAAENPNHGKRDNMSLDKPAAGRFIKAALAGNDKYDQDRAVRQAQEAEGARRKLDKLNSRAAAVEGETAGADNEHTEAKRAMKEQKKQKKRQEKAKRKLEDYVIAGGNPEDMPREYKHIRREWKNKE